MEVLKVAISKEEKARREKAVKELGLTYTTEKDRKCYLFVSYKSDDWEEVFEIVNELQKKYGLRVYWDQAFDYESNDAWLNQMKDNMQSPFCRGVLTFVSKNYMSSYATLLELLYTHSDDVIDRHCDRKENGEPLEFVQIMLPSNGDYNTNALKNKIILNDNKSVVEMKSDEWNFFQKLIKQIEAKCSNSNFRDVAGKLVEKCQEKLKVSDIAIAFGKLLCNQVIEQNADNRNEFLEKIKGTIANLDAVRDHDVFDRSMISNNTQKPIDTVSRQKDESETISKQNVKKEEAEINNKNAKTAKEKTAKKVSAPEKKKDTEPVKEEVKKQTSKQVKAAPAASVAVKTEVSISTGTKSLHDMLRDLMENLGEYAYRYTNATNPEDKKKYKPDGDNWLYNMVNNDIPAAFNSVNFLSDEKYYCKAGCGNGNWATCPWIAVFNLYITYSTTEGVYIVYLLDREKKELYLTLNQGMTAVTKMVDEEISKKGREFIKNKGYKNKDEYIAAILKNSAAKIRKEIGIGVFSDENINTNVWQYDVGCICSKKYTLSDLPSDEDLLNDLADMLKLYDAYYEKHKAEYPVMKEISRKIKKA